MSADTSRRPPACYASAATSQDPVETRDADAGPTCARALAGRSIQRTGPDHRDALDETDLSARQPRPRALGGSISPFPSRVVARRSRSCIINAEGAVYFSLKPISRTPISGPLKPRIMHNALMASGGRERGVTVDWRWRGENRLRRCDELANLAKHTEGNGKLCLAR